jgi:hypothetical protein
MQIGNQSILSTISNQKNLKVNLGCGRNIKPGWINVDGWKRADIDLVCDLTKDFPFREDSCSFIYSEHFIEHLDWLDGYELIGKCFRSLEEGGIFRIVFPDFKKLFKAYIEDDNEFLGQYSDGLNTKDLSYYKSVYENPDKIAAERKDNPPPAWHLSKDENDRRNVKRRAREHKLPIEIIDWAVHQFGEHKTVYDNTLMKSLLTDLGFSLAYDSTYDKTIDSSVYFTSGCCYIEAIK